MDPATAVDTTTATAVDTTTPEDHHHHAHERIPLELERPLLRPCVDCLERSVRGARRGVEKELANLEKGVGMVQKNKEKDITREKAAKFLRAFSQRLKGVKRKLEEAEVEAMQHLSAMGKRIRYLDITAPASEREEEREEAVAAVDQNAMEEDGEEQEDGRAGGQQEKDVEMADTEGSKGDATAAPESGNDEKTAAAAAAAAGEDVQFLERKWKYSRVDRIIVDYLLRCGFYKAAKQLADNCGIGDLVELGLFEKSQKIVDSLRNRRCTEALEWCTENKMRLKKIKSNMEFHLRLQVFVELVRDGKTMDAIKYSRKYFASNSADNFLDIKCAMALLAFGQCTEMSPYRELFDQSRWDDLVHQFQCNNYRIYSLTMEPLLHINIMTGLSSLKVPQSYMPDQFNVNDPLCHEEFQQLAENLPFATHVHSKLVCRITGDLMDDDNPPMVLPNGNAYSLRAMKAMAEEQNGIIVDPRSGDKYLMDELKKSIII